MTTLDQLAAGSLDALDVFSDFMPPCSVRNWLATADMVKKGVFNSIKFWNNSSSSENDRSSMDSFGGGSTRLRRTSSIWLQLPCR